MSEYRDEHAARRAEIEMLTQDLETRRAELAKAREEHARLTKRQSELEEEQRERQSAIGPRDRIDQVLETILWVPIATGVTGMLGTIVFGLLLGIPLMLFGVDAPSWFFYVLGGVFVICAILGARHALRSIWRRSGPEKP